MTRIFNFVVYLKKLKYFKFKTSNLIYFKTKLLATKISRRLIQFCVLLVVLFSAQQIYTLNKSKVLEGIGFSQIIRDRNGQILRILISGDEKYRIWSPINLISKEYIDAVLLMEDQYFYYHPGVNPIALLKSFSDLLLSEKNPPGASTITMQLARIRYGLKTKTIIGKLRQIFYALDLELRHSKKEILEAYLNLIPFGGPIEGVQAASLILFNKMPKDLSTSESLLLATIPQNPNQRRLDNDVEELNEQTKSAFEKLKLRWIKKNPKDFAVFKDIELRSIRRGLKELPFYAPHFTQLIRSKSEDQELVTTLDLELQKKIEFLLRQYLKSKKYLGVHNASVLVTDSTTGEILSYVGSANFFNSEIFGQNDGLLAPRSPGSTLKPFVYALALQQGLIHPNTLLKDLPVQYALYEPENFDKNYLGPISATQALILSRNIPAVDLSYKLSNPTFYEFLQSVDIYFPKSQEYYGLSLVLGGTEITPWKIAELYSMLAKHGDWSRLKWSLKHKIESHKILSSESAFMTLEMLTQAPRSNDDLSSKWMLSKLPMAWKTGTSHGFRDAWTAGLVGPYTIVVWFGNFNNTPNHAFIGKDLAAPFFFSLADLLKSFKLNPSENYIEEQFKDPKWLYTENINVKEVSVCASSGLLPGPHCEHKKTVWFHPGVSPIAKCDVHRPVIINVATQKRSCHGDFKNSMLEIYEFWPNDIQKLFKSAGIHRKEPPEFMSDCKDDHGSLSHSSIGPKIISPPKNVVFLKSQSLKSNLNTISLSAVIDGDSKYMHWYLNKDFIKKTSHDETFLLEPPVGEHKLTVIDEYGRADTQKITVQSVQ